MTGRDTMLLEAIATLDEVAAELERKGDWDLSKKTSIVLKILRDCPADDEPKPNPKENNNGS